jgi:hypothetical protein
MPTTGSVRPEDDLDHAVSDVLQYLALLAMQEGELAGVGRQMYVVVEALLTSQEGQGQLSAYRADWLRRIRSIGMSERQG